MSILDRTEEQRRVRRSLEAASRSWTVEDEARKFARRQVARDGRLNRELLKREVGRLQAVKAREQQHNTAQKSSGQRDRDMYGRKAAPRQPSADRDAFGRKIRKD